MIFNYPQITPLIADYYLDKKIIKKICVNLRNLRQKKFLTKQRKTK